MLQLSLVFLALVAVCAQASPIFQKRIAQTIADSTTQWEAACLAANGGQQCNPLSITAFTTLLAAAGACDQQNAADSMIDLAKQLNSQPMIIATQIFVQQPRNTPNSQAVPYCQQAPKNAELNGLFQCQFQGANLQTFVGGLSVGSAGTIPFGKTAPLNPPGSCPANPNGPIAAGTQLSAITSNPNAPDGSGAPASALAAPTASPAAAPSASSAPPPNPPPTSAAANTPAASPVTSSGFALSNGKAAQQLNAQFSTLTATSPCTAGENACVGGGFAQCVNGAFVTQSCAATLTCVALPLVNSAGTSITCTTTADAVTRINATGASGGLTG